MGNDGGSIPTRRELVKEAAKTKTATEVKESQHEQQEYYWTTDPISQKPLAQPVVSDCNGKLYNKVTILEYLVEGSHKEDAERATLGAVKSLKDVVEVKFDVDAESSTTANESAARETWKCPITGDKLGPGAKAVYLVPCGHAFSGSAIKEVSGEKCLSCETEYAPNDIIPILPTPEADIARLSLRMRTLQDSGLTHSLKKASGQKKRKQRNEASTNGTISKGDGINEPSTATFTAKVEQEVAKKRKKESENVRGLFSTNATNGYSGDFMTRGFSIAGTKK